MRQIECAPRSEVPFGTLSLQAGFEELAMPLSHSLYNFARWLAHNQHDAEDLVQETYLKALRNFASFEPGTNFRAWIFKILKNTFLTACSKQEHLMTIPAVGPITALTWALEVGEVSRFSSIKKAISYCGLCGAEKSSGNTIQRTPLSKQRNKHLQCVLIEAAKMRHETAQR